MQSGHLIDTFAVAVEIFRGIVHSLPHIVEFYLSCKSVLPRVPVHHYWSLMYTAHFGQIAEENLKMDFYHYITTDAKFNGSGIIFIQNVNGEKVHRISITDGILDKAHCFELDMEKLVCSPYSYLLLTHKPYREFL
jgi:hypothetical protein